MCNPGLAWRIVRRTACLLLLSAASSEAQTQAEYRTRIEHLVPVWRSVTTEARLRDSIRARELPTDTVRSGVLRTVADSGLTTLAKESASAAQAAITQRFGDETGGLTSHLYALTIARPVVRFHPAVDFGEVDATGKPVHESRLPATVEAVSASWAMRASEVLTRRLGPAFGEWLDNAIPVDSPSTALWVGVRIDLVTSAYRASRQCYGGDVHECERALGVADDSNPIADWFTLSERQQIIYRDRYRLRGARPQALERCLAHNDDSACLMLGALIPRRELAPPLGPASRQSLLGLAMTIGGRGSYARMVAAPPVLSAQLTAASRLPTDSLVARWRARVLTTKAANSTMTPGLAIMSLFWVAACGGLALGSSRWR